MFISRNEMYMHKKLYYIHTEQTTNLTEFQVYNMERC